MNTKNFIKRQIFFIILNLISLIPFNLLADYLVVNYFKESGLGILELMWFSLVEAVLFNICYNLWLYYDEKESK